MSLEELYGFDPADTKEIFAPEYFRLIQKGSFEPGLNNLFVFEKL